MLDTSPRIHARRNGAPTRLNAVTQLDEFLRSPAAMRCSRMLVIRTSNDSKVQFEAMFRAGVALLPDDPDVRILADEGPSIVSPDGVQRREALGAMELRRGSVAGGWGTKLLGWLIPIGRTLFVLYLESARTADLVGPTRDQARNAFTEALCAAVRAVRPAEIHTPILNRLVRNVDFGQQVLRTLREYDVELWVAGERLQLTGNDGLRAILESYFAAKDANETVQRLTGIEASMYAAGEWYVTAKFLPFTWRPKVLVGVNPITKEPETNIPDIRDLEVTPGSVPVFDAFVALLTDRSKTLPDIGVAMGALGLRSRAPRHFSGPAPLHELQQPGHAIATLIDDRWLGAWLDGRYRTSVRLKADLRTSHPALAGQIAERETKNGGTELWLDVEVRLPLPDRGYWLTAQDHERIVDVRRAPTPQRIGKAASRGDRRPLSSLSQWDDPASGRQYRLATFDSTSDYVCLWRNLRDAYAVEAEGGVPFSLGWSDADKANKLAVLPATTVHESIGGELIRLAAELEGQAAVLAVPARALPGRQELTRAKADLDQAMAQRARIDARMAGIRQDRQEARGRGDAGEVADLERDRGRAEEDLARADRDVDECRSRLAAQGQPAAPRASTVEVDLGSIELVGVALTRCGTFAPAVLNDALAHLLGTSLRVRPMESGLGVDWDAVVEVPLAAGGTARHPIRSPQTIRGIAFTTRRGGQVLSPDWTEQLVTEFMDNGMDMAQLCRIRAVDDSGRTDSYPVKRIRVWLAEHGIVDSLRRRAALDAPAEVRRTLARLLRGQAPDTGYERALLAAYTSNDSWGVCWAAHTHAVTRRAVLAMNELGGGELDPLDVADRAGIPWADLVSITGTRPVTRGHGRPVHVGPALNRNWKKGKNDPTGRRIWIPTCPHPDCHGILRGTGPGALVQLVVPELGSTGLLCQECRRRPDDAGAVFPAMYLLPWIGGRRTSAQVGGRLRMIGTHLAATDEAPLITAS